MKEEHKELYTEVVISQNLKYSDTLALTNGPSMRLNSRHHKEFTLEGFHERLVRWIAVDDQVRFSCVIGLLTLLIINIVYSRCRV